MEPVHNKRFLLREMLTTTVSSIMRHMFLKKLTSRVFVFGTVYFCSENFGPRSRDKSQARHEPSSAHPLPLAQTTTRRMVSLDIMGIRTCRCSARASPHAHSLACDCDFIFLKRVGPTGSRPLRGETTLGRVHPSEQFALTVQSQTVHRPREDSTRQNTVSQRQPVGLRCWLQPGVDTAVV